ncbi:MAG: NAD(P)/FAD-dependent oxidoreductase [Rhizobiales bacterium]|nr:NAD(P)/FAD-dependent oxidoreductase [Hyphomicrobiales bacterium]
MDNVEVLVIGAGAIGLAVARALAQAGREVIVIERNPSFGMETSSRNNEVIHASIFHVPGSPQGILCRRGRDMLYAYCTERGIDTKRVGKLVLANLEADREWLQDTLGRGRNNGCDDLVWLEKEEVRRLEPEISCHAAILSPSSGIMDTHNLMLAYLGDAEAAGAVVAFNSEVANVEAESQGFRVTISDRNSGENMNLRSRMVINAAGPWSERVARKIIGLSEALIPKVYFSKGTFFKYQGRAPFSHLIVPSQPAWRNGGIFTLDLAGQGKFGPDEEWLDEIDYTLDAGRASGVEAAIRNYWPQLPDGMLTPDYSGIRPRLNGPGEAPANWVFQGPRTHGIRGLINLFGFESPGVTSSLAIAEEVLHMADGEACSFRDEADARQRG